MIAEPEGYDVSQRKTLKSGEKIKNNGKGETKHKNIPRRKNSLVEKLNKSELNKKRNKTMIKFEIHVS